MSGLWVFLIVAVVFGTVGSIVRAAIGKGKSHATNKLIEEMSEKIHLLEGQVSDRPALPPHEDRRIKELEQRIQSLETIVTDADEFLEKRLKEVAKDHVSKG